MSVLLGPMHVLHLIMDISGCMLKSLDEIVSNFNGKNSEKRAGDIACKITFLCSITCRQGGSYMSGMQDKAIWLHQ